MSKIILITGAAGFIGSRTTQFLLDQNYKVVAIDNLNDYYDIRIKKFRLNLLMQDKNFIFYEGDIEDKSFLSDVFKKLPFIAKSLQQIGNSRQDYK